MNRALHAYFRRATSGHNIGGGALAPGVDPQAGKPSLAAHLAISSPFQSPKRALYGGGQYFPSLVVLGMQG